ncbi:MAG TPA: PD-(D/E)XK nuclease family protein, partial [Pyrinomonadaceae bacterium]|nr:PD-(D/E)XK nuclease family protein [Pyrinomonadaceae bacterium]
KQIWLGPVLGNNRERLLARCAEHIANGKTDRLLYIAASHPLLDLVTERLLDGKNAQGVWGEFPVYLFRGFVRRVLSEARPFGRARSSNEPSLTVGLLTQQLLPRTPIDREEFPLRRSLISQIIKQLSTAGRLQAIRPLANRDGCVNTIASLIGELQRAGKTPEEFLEVVAAREIESQAPSLKSPVSSLKTQIDFDREVALIYSAYSDALEKHGLTDEDADQLRALQILRGDVAQVVNLRLLDREPEQSQINNLRYSVPWLDRIDLLVLDGFFDFTPVQGEILKYLIPLIPNVIVNLNGDPRNPDIFRPFQSTIDHLTSIDEFEIETSHDAINVAGQLSLLHARLFNVDARDSSPTPGESANNRQDAGAPQAEMPALHLPALELFECADRELEIRSIAKEIKRLVLTCNYKLSDIALVVRERAAYADTIARVFADEAVPCNLERRVEAPDVPAVRACGKLFQLLKEARESVKNPKASDLAHLIKTDYFRLSLEKLEELNEAFEQKYASQFLDNSDDKLRRALAIGQWNGDNLENAIAYVGGELRVNAWIDRALKLIKAFPSPEAAQSLLAGGEESDDAATIAEDELPPEDGAAMDRRKKPAPIHPAALAWAVLIVRHLQQLLSEMPEEGTPEGLRNALMLLLDRLQFSNRINLVFRSDAAASDAPQATLDVRGRESLRRAIAVAVRSFDYAQSVLSEVRPTGKAEKQTGPSLTVGLLPRITLPSFIDEVERSLRSQVLAIGAANRDGLRVLEATDVRGLRFRAIFIAGMIEGGFPLRTSRDWLYPHEERVRLQKHGIFLEDISTDTLLKEEHYFYQSACRATERLYLTRPLALNDGSEPVASYYIEELKRAIVPAELLVKQIRGDVDGRKVPEASTATELATILIRQGERQNNDAGKKILALPLVKEFLARAEDRGMVSSSALRRVEIEHERNSKWFGPYDGEITNADLRMMLGRHFGTDHVYSASRFSTYGNCSFRFFANRVLKLEPRSEAALDLQAIDAGKLLHDILRRFFEKHRGEYLPLRDHNDLRNELTETADAVFREHEDKVPPLNDRIWKIDCEIRKLILDQVLLYELRLQEKTNARGVRPAYFELAFGRASQARDPNSTTKYLELKRAGETALVQGQIDRVDLNEKERVAVAYDYKLSLGAGLEDIKSGRQVQIPIYLAALERLFLPGFQLGGGGYYTLRGKGPRLNKGLYRLAFADCTNVTWAKGMLDDVEWRRVRDDVAKRVWEFIDGMRGGHFSVKPSLGRLTCKFCDYSAVCRYDAYRISRKRTEAK